MSELKTHIELEVDVYYEFQPYEPPTSEYPGCDADIEYITVEFGGIDITEKIDKYYMEILYLLCLECEVKKPQER